MAFDNAGTVVLGLINCSISGQIFPLNEGAVQSSTAISGTATAAGTYYTPNGTTITSKSIRILGYCEWNAGLTTAGTYNALPTAVRLFGPGIKKPGDTVQSVFNSSASASIISQAITITSSVNIVRLVQERSLRFAYQFVDHHIIQARFDGFAIAGAANIERRRGPRFLYDASGLSRGGGIGDLQHRSNRGLRVELRDLT